MAYWWVSQNQTFKPERDGGYLWAPKAKKNGQPPFYHWANMAKVRPGDVIFSSYRQAIVAVSIATSGAYDAKQPGQFDLALWQDDGWMVDVSYQDLPLPLPVASIADQLQPLLGSFGSPLNRHGTGVQGYLFEVPDAAGRFLLAATNLQALEVDPAHEPDAEIVKAIASLDAPLTERQALILSRVGQGRFRQQLLDYWDGCCAVSGLAFAPLLRASHIKPWRNSNNVERLDPYNGLLLAPSYDAAFDAGLISFTDEGSLMVGSLLTPPTLQALGIDPGARLRHVHPLHLPYLALHRSAMLDAAIG